MSDIRINQLGTHLKVKKFDASRRFYDALGFQTIREFGPESAMQERYRGIVYGVGDAYLEIAEGHKPVKPEVFEEAITSSKVSLMVNVASLLPVIEACDRNGIEIAVPPRRYPWGAIELVVQDPDGFVIVFVADSSGGEARALQVKFDAALDREEPDYTEAHVASIRRRTAEKE